MKGKKVFRSLLALLVLLGLACTGTAFVPVDAETVNIPSFSGYATGALHDAGGGYSQITYSGTTLSRVTAYEQQLVKAGFTLYDLQEIKNGSDVNRFATYVNGDTMVHLNLFEPLFLNKFHIIYGPADKLIPNTKAAPYTAVITPSVAIIERTDGVLCMVVQLTDGSYYVIDGGYAFSSTEPTTIPAKEEHRDGSGVTYTYSRDHVKDMEVLLAYLQDTNRDGTIDDKDQKPQVNWMITHADPDHIQLPYMFIKDYNSKFDLNSVYYNFPNYENIGLSSSYSPEELTKSSWDRFVAYTNTYFPNAKEYIYHTGQTAYLPGCKVEFLYTPEDLYPGSMTTPNHTCGIWRFCFDNGKTFLVTGDAEKETNQMAADVLGSYLKSDMMQVIHHGSNGATTDFYNAVDPDICFWPCLDTSFYHDLRHLGSYSGYSFNAVLRNGQRTHYTTSSTKIVYLPTLRYDANGGTGTVQSVGTLYSGNTANEGTSPNGVLTVAANGFTGPDGRAFLGWATTPDGQVQYQPGDQITVMADTVLYAVWKASSYTVTFMDGSTVMKTETVKPGENVTLPALPETTACSVKWDHTGENITADTIIRTVHTPHQLTHIEAVPGDCKSTGSLEHWLCMKCYCLWLDEELTVSSDLWSVSTGYGDHNYVDGTCDICGEADPDYVEPIVKFDFLGSNANLGNSLAMNFALAKANVSDWTGHYAEITRETETGEIKTTTIPVSGWTSSGAYYLIPYEGLAAKEMCDPITVTVYNAEGKAVSVTREESIAIYAVRTLELEQAKAASKQNKELMTALVDMLYYGEAAQVYFKYNTDDLPTDLLDDVQKAMATGDVTATDSRVKDAKCLGTNLNLENKILMTAVFSGVKEGMTAKYSFTNHDDKLIESDVAIDIQGNYAYVYVDTLAIADVSKMVTITIYNADGTPYSTVSESMESYIARSTGDLAVLCEAIMKFGTGAFNYFH